MDYMFRSVLQSFEGLLFMIISYDIACQWFINLHRHMDEWPSEIASPSATLTPAIPKFHEPMHKQQNHQEFSCNYIKGMGSSDCEVPECIWEPNNALGNSTKMMGPGSWHDVIDNNFGAWNWQKYIGMGEGFLQYMAAVKERNMQVEGHRGFSASLPSNLTVENPFATNEEYMSEEDVEKELEAEEEERHHEGGRVYHETSAHKFVALRLSLEESQQKVKTLAVQHRNPTMRQGATLKEERSILREKLRSWLLLHTIYIPGLVQYLTEMGELSHDGGENLEDVALWLPSSLPKGRRQVLCMEGLPKMEERFQTVQCHDALNGVQHMLHVKTQMIHFRNKNTHGQAPSTWARSVINGVHQCALKFATKYRSAHVAKLELAGSGDWEETLCVLENKDIRSYSDLEHKKGPGRRGNNEDNDGTDNNEKILQTEWCKSRARAKRSSEEVLLLREEMCCVLKFLKWKAQWWEDRQRLRDLQGDDGLAGGLAAFAQEQRVLQESLKVQFETLWKTLLEDHEPESEDGEDLSEDEDSDGSDQESEISDS
ncbi:uncharacterized protein ARMOST_15509 [Armillaria ostoyae]|uniref:Uncharacterized protein n=1 Tax=Armillaria ostoyae TaxID=47428 RepID=A0A284RTJ7_ARMOS|nr:uncharacterized protein ARMOST_15509 [Armillaria ostoyae]